MTDAEKAALEWLERPRPYVRDEEKAATLRRMLAEPRLPKEPSKEALEAMYSDWYRALYAQMTAPKTKIVQVYTVHCKGLSTEFSECGLSLEDVAAAVENFLRKGHSAICVTGPFNIEVRA